MTRHKIKFDLVGYGLRYGISGSARNNRLRSFFKSSTTFDNSSTCSKETCAAILAATLTLYGCLDFHRGGINQIGNAPYPIRRPASPAQLLKVRRTTRFSREGTS